MRWLQVSKIGVGVVGAVTAYVVVVEATHSHHHEEKPEYEHLKIRTKAFPWSCEDCALFDTACWKKCRSGEN